MEQLTSFTVTNFQTPSELDYLENLPFHHSKVYPELPEGYLDRGKTDLTYLVDPAEVSATLCFHS